MRKLSADPDYFTSRAADSWVVEEAMFGLSDDEVAGEVALRYHLRTHEDLALMRLVVEVERRRLYRRQGYESTQAWFSNTMGTGYRRACEFVEVALALNRFSGLREAYREGVLSYDHLRALVEVVDEENEAELIRQVEGLSVSDTFKMVQDLTKLTSVDSLIAKSQRWFQKSWDKAKGLLFFSGVLPQEEGAAFERVIDAKAKTIPDDPHLGKDTPMGVKMADALMEAVTTSSAVSPRKPLVVVHVDEHTLLHKQEGVAYLEGGPNIAPETARKLACGAVVRIVTKGKDGKPVALGSATPSVPGRLASEIRNEQGDTCVVAGCPKRGALEFHHVDWVSNNGVTEHGNIVMLCKGHHDMVHVGGWSLKGTFPKIWLEHPDSPPLKVGPPPLTDEIKKQLKFAIKEIEELAQPKPEPWEEIWRQKFRR